MKKTIIAAAVAAAVAAPAAMADVTVYGKIHQALNDGEIGVNGISAAASASGESQNSNASRLGVKGTEDLGNGMSAFFQMEYASDNSDGQDMGGARDGFVGVKGNFGTVALGRMAGATKATLYGVGNVQLADSHLGSDYASAFQSKADRHNNVVAYKNSFNGVNVTLAAAGNDTGNTVATMGTDNFAHTSIGFDTTIGGAKIAVAQLNSDGTGKDTTIAGVKMSFDALTVGVVYEDAEKVASGQKILNVATAAAFDAETTGISASYAMGNNVVSVAYTDSEVKSGATTTDVNATFVNLQHKLSKRTSAYISFADYEAKVGSTTGNADNMSIGLIHSF